MTHQKDEHKGHDRTGHDHHHGSHPVPWSQRWHKDWRLWAIVALMLVAMAVYVLSDNESIGPEGVEQPAVPAAQ
jgi:hypothetical protein